MGNTCSYKIDNELIKNDICFGDLIMAYKKNKDVIIIIEPNKQTEWGFTLDQINTYLNDLQNMGFLFSYAIIDGDYEIIINSGMKKCQCIALCMAIRYIWEITEGSYNIDDFYVTINYFNDLKLQYPNDNLLTLFCLAHNLALINELNSYNTNHYWCYENGCKLLTSIDQFRSDVNESTRTSLKNDDLNCSTIDELYNYLKDKFEIK